MGLPMRHYVVPMTLVVVGFLGSFLLTRMTRRPDRPDGAASTRPAATDAPRAHPPGMVWVPGGTFTMGTDDPRAAPSERPAHRVRVGGFWMDTTEVTNARFRRFVEATGYVTTAERPVDWEQLKAQLPPGTPRPPDDRLAPGSLVFAPPAQAIPLDDPAAWWRWTAGANWRHPDGPGSAIEGKDDHPVVQVSWDDADAFARWAGKRLPTEAEWEFAARGDTLAAGGTPPANTWQGHFPEANSAADGYPRTAPAASFPADRLGLHDMIGNVWEWTADWYRPDAYRLLDPRTVADNPKGPDAGFNPDHPYQPERVTRGGSFLCGPDYCSNARPGARRGTAVDSGMSHLGFRCVRSPG